MTFTNTSVIGPASRNQSTFCKIMIIIIVLFSKSDWVNKNAQFICKSALFLLKTGEVI